MPPQPAHSDLRSAQSVIFNGNVYKSLADLDPHSTTAIYTWYNKRYKLDPAWQICPKTPDALHVCANYPWAAHFLVFADGSAHYTALAPTLDSSLQPGKEPGGKHQYGGEYCLGRDEGRYGVSISEYRLSYFSAGNPCRGLAGDVLIVRKTVTDKSDSDSQTSDDDYDICPLVTIPIQQCLL
jgi:hypothetical protein